MEVNTVETTSRVIECEIARVEEYWGVVYYWYDNKELGVFRFSKIENYRGERPKELKRFSEKGIANGIRVLVEQDQLKRIRKVSPMPR